MNKTSPCMSDEELARIQIRRVQAQANDAIEGIHLTAEEQALFEQFDNERLTHEERRQAIKEIGERLAKGSSGIV